MAIDWGTTGTWMQAWAAFAQAGAVAFVGYKGADVFTQWRRQKISERRLDVAERTLTTAYRVRGALSAIRSPMMWAGETDAAEAQLREAGTLGLNQHETRDLAYSQAYLNRTRRFDAMWTEAFELAPSLRALFSADLSDALATLLHQRHKVNIAASMYNRSGELERDFRRQLERELWEGDYPPEGNPMDNDIKRLVETLETGLIPELRLAAAR